MAQTNPFAVKDTYEIDYVGFAEEFYCFRLNFAGKGGLDACMFQMEVSQWAFDTTQGRWHMGNDFPYADHPKIKFVNKGDSDYFVLFDTFADVVMFEHEFPLRGVKPSTLK